MSGTDDKGAEGKPVSLEQDPYVDRLRPNPADPAPKIIELRGHLGRDTAAGYWRLYLSSDLGTYLRIAESDIVHLQRSDSPGANLEPSRVVVRASAEVEGVRDILLENQASFLQGEYTAALAAPSRTTLAVALAAIQRRRQWRDQESIDPRYPNTPGFPCRPEITIEHDTCYCTIFCTM